MPAARSGGQGTALVPSSPTWHVQLLRLLFQVVLRPTLASCPPGSLAAHTQLPPAAVRQVLHSLREQGFWLADAPPGTSPLRLPAPAQYWLAHYGSVLRRRLNGQRYRPCYPTALAEWAQRGLPVGCLWSGAAAAHLLLGRHPPAGPLVLHSQVPRPQLVRRLGLVAAPKGPIEILNAFAPLLSSALPDPRCVPPLLAYADLLASSQPPDAELAQELRQRYLLDLLGC